MDDSNRKTAKKAKSEREHTTDGGETRSKAKRAYSTGLVQGTELPDNPGVEIPRLQGTELHYEFADPVAEIVMIGVHTARRLNDKGKTAEEVYGDALVVVTTTVSDEVLEEWYPQKETQLVREFQPDFYIPCDRPVYRKDSKAERRDLITRYVNDLREIAREIEPLDTEIIPLVKGILPRERERCYRCFAELGFDRIGYYCAQYFLYGNRGNELVSDVRQIAQEAQPTGMLLIGLQAQSRLWEMPPEVIAAAGERWRGQSGLRDDALSMREVQRQYRKWSEEVEDYLSGGQSRLEMFDVTETSGGIHGN